MAEMIIATNAGSGSNGPKITILDDYYRHDVVKLLQGNKNVGIELGVAEGVFSERMVKSGKFDRFFGVDMYADHHDTKEYVRALARIGLNENYKLLRMRFDEAITLFDDRSFDFIYVDGYAHSGEEGGETIFDWFKKLKVGGVIAGDDYHPRWPLVIRSVHEFCRETGHDLMVTGRTEPDTPWCAFPTWAVRKERDVDCSAPSDIVNEGKRANEQARRSKDTVLYHARQIARLIIRGH